MEPGFFSGIFPDGVLGRRNVTHNRGLIENFASTVLGDDQARADLERMGQLGSVELLVDQGLKAPNRREQQPVLDALGKIVDGLGLWERDRVEASRLDQSYNESLAAAAGFVGPEQREQIAQLADEAQRAYMTSQYNPSAGMEQYRALDAKIQTLTDTAASNINSQFIQPLRALELDTAKTREQLLQSSGGNLDQQATPQEVTQVLNQLNTSGTQEFGGLGLSIPFIGGFGPDDVPNMTYAELLNTLESNLKGAQGYVAEELERRGAGVIQRSRNGYLPTDRTTRMASDNEVRSAVESFYNAPDAEAPDVDVASVASQYGGAVDSWLSKLPEGTQLDATNMQAVLPDGTTRAAPPSARSLLEQIRRRSASRSRRAVND